MKILLVEDSATLRYAMSRYIKLAGHQPVFAENGETALQMVDAGVDMDMIIMDVEMPGLNGFETTRLMREILKDQWIPIIFVTGKSDEEDLEEGIDAGGDDYLIKPVSQAILQAKMKAMERLINTQNELKALNRSLTKLSEEDGLTHLYNRRTFDQKASEHWKDANSVHTALSVLILDIDHFKLYNDCYGHLTGDKCIQAVSQAIKSSVQRPSDLVARYGGEEFIILLPNTHQEGARLVAERIRASVESLMIKHATAPTADHVTVSVGGASVNFTADANLVEMISAADKALYTAKNQGRNNSHIETYTPCATVLVVSDDAKTRDIIDRQLENQCCTIQTSTGKEACEIIALNQPKVVVTDQNLPDMTASALSQQLSLNLDFKDLPIVVVGDGQMPSDKAANGECYTHGNLAVKEYLETPLNEESFILKLSKYLK